MTDKDFIGEYFFPTETIIIKDPGRKLKGEWTVIVEERKWYRDLFLLAKRFILSFLSS